MAEPEPLTPELEAHLEALHGASFGWALHCCAGHSQDAEDVLQSAYLKILTGRARFAGRSSLRTWLFGVIRLTALESRRKQRQGERRDEVLALHLDPPGDGAPPPDAILEGDDVPQRLREAMDRLPQRQREVLHLVFYQEMSVREAADVMEISLGSARVHYDRGKKRLRSLLGLHPADTGAGEEGEYR
jgi:RNA polymerase sigma factor (sigma-70 family)